MALQSRNDSRQRGFALILVLGILLVAALVVGTIMARQEVEATWSPATKTKERLANVQQAIAAYERKNHRLPMPAARTKDTTGTLPDIEMHTEALGWIDTDFSLPVQVEDALRAGAPSVPLGGGIDVVSSDPSQLKKIMIVGAVPTQTLGLPREAGEDKTGHLLTYAVTAEMISPFTYSTAEGAISIKDMSSGGSTLTDLAYVILSHGKDAKGAWSAKNRYKGRECGGDMNGPGGNAAGGTGAGDEGLDSENCSHKESGFVTHDFTLTRGSDYFDDQILQGKRDAVAISQNQPCVGPFTVTWADAALCPTCACTATVPAPGLVSIGAFGEPTSIDLIDNTPADTGEATYECENGVPVMRSGSCIRPCNLPWGGTIANGESVQAYAQSIVPCGSTCSASTRTCVNGTLSGSGDAQSCAVAPCGGGGVCGSAGSCLTGSPFGDNGLTACDTTRTWMCLGVSGGSNTNCSEFNGACSGGPVDGACGGGGGECIAGDLANDSGDLECGEDRTWICMGSNGGSTASCSAPSPCEAVDGVCGSAMATCATGTVNDDSGATPCGDDRTWTCLGLNGGSAASCSAPNPCGSCALPASLGGGTLLDGETVQSYASATVACGETCPAPVTRTCDDGTLSPGGDYAECEVAACGSCALPWGGTIPDGQSVQAYTAHLVPCPGACPAPTTRTCHNGVLDGVGNWANCDTEPGCEACTTPWGTTIAHGQGVRAYQSNQTNSCHNPCPSEMRNCNNGTLSGSYSEQNCESMTCTTGCNAGPMCVISGDDWTDRCINGRRSTYMCTAGVNIEIGAQNCMGSEHCE